MADQPKRPTERTPRAGVEVPIPKRGEVLENLDKIAKGGPAPDKPKK